VDVTDLATEVEALRAELEAVSAELDIERAHRNILHRTVLRLREGQSEVVNDAILEGAVLDEDGNIYVFDDEDASVDAFDEFFAAPDPHLDKVRGFLLD
jgi:hypothetical protein